MALQVPPDVARARQQQMMEANQLYSMAFELYKSCLRLYEDDDVATANRAIAAAKTFREEVQRDMKQPVDKHVPTPTSPPIQGMEDLL